MSTRRKVIIDTDPGIDDALAIFFALARPELNVIGLTTVFGNAAVEACTRNALTNRKLAAEIIAAQKHEIGEMCEWLRQRNVPQP